MWFTANKNESSEARNISTTFHREKTQKINTKPPLNSLMDGLLPCNHCGLEIDMDTCIGLSIQRCPNCDTPIFIPLRVKDYWLYEPLGGGGMGSVYHAFHVTNIDAEYAVKVLPRKRKHEQFLIDSQDNTLRTIISEPYSVYPDQLLRVLLRLRCEYANEKKKS